MSNRTISIDDRLYRYLLEHSLRETPEMRALRETTATLARAHMQISPEQGQFMALLVELTGARRIIEIGTFTGYSALCMARAMPPDGELVCCDVSTEWTAVGIPFWERAGVRERIDLRIAPAVDTLDTLIAVGGSGTFDMAFVDADKEASLDYYERCLQLLRPGGLVMFDNTLWSGSVADPADQDADTIALRELNRTLHADQRVSISLVPIGDGLTLARKR
ncbi:MAG: class I SAM-dependent methyltransferase [Chromatiaceae bacterium]|nr:class I SAM-dependent methyltransferase [Gammaproteobacteria bacterium]MCP5300531.1 class I SAM-dependent methyltransferase [Chromatiaceae bacterium]MCP5422603.1 class I SAM-dependent methyltransferase [Chromatiaceae bacterium]